jgi:hydrogenase maturation protein HypF
MPTWPPSWPNRACKALLGLALDGYGLGKNGGAWGGELMMLEGASCERMGHITPLPLPGGDKAAREPWRMAVGLWHRLASELPCRPPARAPRPAHAAAPAGNRAQLPGHHQHGALVRRHCRPGWHLPGTKLRERGRTKAGSLASDCAPLAGGWQVSAANLLDLSPLARQLLQLTDPVAIASLWHATLAHALADWASVAASTTGMRQLVLAGGCCANRQLLQQLLPLLRDNGLQVYTARPCRPTTAA